MTKLRGVVCVGLDKCGTSWLHQVLRLQGLEDFGVKENGMAKMPGWRESHRVMVDINHNYFKLNADLDLIEIFDDLLVILMLRDPVERARSHFNEFRKRGEAHSSIFSEENVQEVMHHSAYESIVRSLHRRFDKRLHIIFFEDIAENPLLVVKSICEKLGVDVSEDKVLTSAVNTRVVPRNRFFAAMVKFVGRLLRVIGMHRLLTAARENEVLRGMVYRQTRAGDSISLPASILVSLERAQSYYTELRTTLSSDPAFNALK